MSYRLDGRTKSEFKKQIKKHSIQELEIALRICTWHKNTNGKWPDLEPNGSDYTGEYLESKKVTSAPDFKIDNKFFEITKSNGKVRGVYHQKVGKINKAISNGYVIVFVNGISLKTPDFIMVEGEELESLTDKSIEEFGLVKMPGYASSGVINKDAYRYKVEWSLNWETLPVMPKTMPRKYEKFLSFLNEHI